MFYESESRDSTSAVWELTDPFAGTDPIGQTGGCDSLAPLMQDKWTYTHLSDGWHLYPFDNEYILTQLVRKIFLSLCGYVRPSKQLEWLLIDSPV